MDDNEINKIIARGIEAAGGGTVDPYTFQLQCYMMQKMEAEENLEGLLSSNPDCANIVDYSNAFKAWRKFIHVALWRMDGNEYELVSERDHEYNSDTNLAARVAGAAAAFGYGYAKLGELAVYVTAIPNGVEFRSKTHKMTIEVKIEVK